MRLDIMGEGISPCPTQYHGGKLDFSDNMNKMPVGSFRSKSLQRPKTTMQDIPGPGTYAPRESIQQSAVKRTPRDAGIYFRSRSHRFSGLMLFDRSHETGPDIGPGAYEMRVTMNGNRSTISGLAQSEAKSGRNATFRSDSVRDLTGKFFAREPYF